VPPYWTTPALTRRSERDTGLVRAIRALEVVTAALLAACGADAVADAHFVCDRHAEAATGDLSADIVGRWHLVRHYTDTRYYDFHADGTVAVWYVGLGEQVTQATVGWSADGTTLRVGETPPVEFAMSLDPSPIGQIWRAPAEYVFYPCA
jgi:hypothetical protein